MYLLVFSYFLYSGESAHRGGPHPSRLSAQLRSLWGRCTRSFFSGFRLSPTQVVGSCTRVDHRSSRQLSALACCPLIEVTDKDCLLNLDGFDWTLQAVFTLW